MALEEAVIGHYVDPDFGPLDLIETRTQASLNGGLMTPFVFRQWRGKHPELLVALNISTDANPPIVADEVRTDFRTAMSNVNSFKQRIARSQLQMAKEWLAIGGVDFPLDESKFAALLEVGASQSMKTGLPSGSVQE